MCFIHVLLNALDMGHKGYDAKIIIEGAATKLIPELKKRGILCISYGKKPKVKDSSKAFVRLAPTKPKP